MRKKVVFRVVGVKNALVQTLLSDVRLGHQHITHVGIDASGANASVKLSDTTRYLSIGTVPSMDQHKVQAMMGEPVQASLRVLGGGWSIQTPTVPPREIYRYGDRDMIPETVMAAVIQGDYVSVRLNHGLEVTLETR